MGQGFPGGVHPPENKHYSADKPIETLPALADHYICLLSQHLGAPARAVVKRKDKVKKGQVIAEAGGYVSCPIHAPTSGQIVKETQAWHPVGRQVPALIIEPDGADEWLPGLGQERDWGRLDPAQLREEVHKAGIAGMGGATFPTHVKLNPPDNKPIDTLIINGAECEPYLTCDARLMIEQATEIVRGARMVQKILAARQVYIGIEANKPEACEQMRQAVQAHPEIQIRVLKVKYPQGAEKQLIKSILNRCVPAGGLPMDVGVVCINVGTAHAISQAIRYQRPLIERVVTITGDGVGRPCNLMVRLGTPIKLLLEHAAMRPDCQKLISGGPMMGFALSSLDIPVIKGLSGLVALTKVPCYQTRDCIRCGACSAHCPMRLQPHLLSAYLQRDDFDKAAASNLMDCIECGCCTYVCPARRPIVHQIKYGKNEIIKRRAAAKQAQAKSEGQAS